MKNFDVVIVGAGVRGLQMAKILAQKKINAGLIELPDAFDTRFERLLSSLVARKPVQSQNSAPIEGISVLKGQGRFTGPQVFNLDGQEIFSKKFILATGAAPKIPSIQGLDEVSFRFPLDMIDLATTPRSAAIIGAGPIGVALTDYLGHKNCHISLFSKHNRLLPREEPELAEKMSATFTKSGVHVETQVKVIQIRKVDRENQVVYEKDGVRAEVIVDEIIIATGMIPNVSNLGLDKAGIYVNETGRVVTNEDMRTSSKFTFAAGAITAQPFSILLEEYQARLAANNVTANFLANQKFESESFPFVIPTTMPFAKVGLTEQEAKDQRKKVHTSQFHFDQNTKASLTGKSQGMIKLVGRKRGGQLLGAHIWAPHAEEMILFFNLILRAEISLHDLLDRQHYPPLTYGEAIYNSILNWTTTV